MTDDKKLRRKLLKRHLRYEIDLTQVRKWGKFFWCPTFNQYTMLSFCNARWRTAGEFPCYQACVTCPIRRESFRKLRKPRIVVRKPR